MPPQQLLPQPWPWRRGGGVLCLLLGLTLRVHASLLLGRVVAEAVDADEVRPGGVDVGLHPCAVLGAELVGGQVGQLPQLFHLCGVEALVQLGRVATEEEPSQLLLARVHLEVRGHRERVGGTGAHAQPAVDALRQVDVEARRAHLVVLVALAVHREAVDGTHLVTGVADDADVGVVDEVAAHAVTHHLGRVLGVLARDVRRAALVAQVLDEEPARGAHAGEEGVDALDDVVDPGEDHEPPPVSSRRAGCMLPCLRRAATTSSTPGTSGTSQASTVPMRPVARPGWAGSLP